MVEENFYEILNLKPFSTLKEIRKAFIKKALESHPHRTGVNSEEEFIKIKNAYDKLSDSTFKLSYDKILLQKNKQFESQRENFTVKRNNSNDKNKERIFESRREHSDINNSKYNKNDERRVFKDKKEYKDFKFEGKKNKEKIFKSDINLENLVKIHCKSVDLNFLKFKCKRFGKIKRFIVKESFVFIEFRNMDSLKLFFETEKNNFSIRRLFYFDEEVYKTESDLFDRLKKTQKI